jgi:hypothetical protein
VLVRHGFFCVPANSEWDLFCHAENLSKPWIGRKKKGQATGAWPEDQLRRNLVVIVVIMVPAMASCPRIFQVTTLALRLAAVLSVFALCIMQFALGCAYAVFALSVIVAVNRPRRNCPSQERENHECGNQGSGFCKHATSSECRDYLIAKIRTAPVTGARSPGSAGQ